MSTIYYLTLLLAFNDQTVAPPTYSWPVGMEHVTYVTNGAPAKPWPVGPDFAYLMNPRPLASMCQ